MSIASDRIPLDLAAPLAARPDVRRNFDAFPTTAKQLIVAWLDAAKRSDARQERIDRTLRLAARNRRPV